MKERYGAVTIGFTGWAIGSRYKSMMGLDHVIPLSDHCDYKELVGAVKQCNPEKVYTFHGFSQEFADSLFEIGFDSEAIGRKKEGKGKMLTLDSFMQ
jgi:putative mRNA 3-end processing factor